MKANKCVYVCICLLVVAPILFAEDYKKEIPVEEAMKAFCVTWINVSDPKNYCQKDIYYNNGKYEWYWIITDTEPGFTGTFKIEKAWKDGEGNTWFTVWRTYKGGTWALNKVSNSGTVLELNRYFKPDNPPSKIDSDDPSYPYFRYTKKNIK